MKDHQDKCSQLDCPEEGRVSPRQLWLCIKGMSRALPDRSHDCLRLVDRACRPLGEECRCERCAVERRMISAGVLGQSWVELEMLSSSSRDFDRFFQQNSLCSYDRPQGYLADDRVPECRKIPGVTRYFSEGCAYPGRGVPGIGANVPSLIFLLRSSSYGGPAASPDRVKRRA